MSLTPSLVWFFIGVAFLVAELLLPGFILIFFTMGCWLTALAAGLMGIETSVQILVFMLSSVVFLLLLRRFCIKIFKGEKVETLDDNYVQSKVGKTAVVTKAILPNFPGEIQAMGSYWRAVSDHEIAVGKAVIIEAKASEDGLTLKVKPI
jgi:inner membrane protein